MAYTAPLRGFYWKACPGARRPLHPLGPRQWLLEPPAHRPRALALALFEPRPVGAAAENGVHQELGGRGVVELECDLGRLGNPTDGAAHAARGSQGSRHQGGPGRARRPQGGSPSDGLARGVHVRFAQERPKPGRNGLGYDGAYLLRKGFPGILEDLGARKERKG